jgi:hypothetical protein
MPKAPALLVLALLSCRVAHGQQAAPARSDHSDDFAIQPGQHVVAGAIPHVPGPPPVQAACTRDEECAVAHVEVTGANACCPACGTTPGARYWYATLRRFCAQHPPTGCGALACPMGPTRAICRSGRCEATFYGPDGGPVLVMDRERCLPALGCDTWDGCALVIGNDQDGWFIESADHAAPGDAAFVGSVCTTARCEGVRYQPTNVVCPAWTVPPRIDPPSYACAVVGGRCVRAARGR